MTHINWTTWLVGMALVAVVAVVTQHYPRSIWPWGVAAYTLLFAGLVAWVIADRRRPRRRP